MDAFRGLSSSDKSSSPDASSSSAASRLTTPDLDSIPWDRRIDKPIALWHGQGIAWTASGELSNMEGHHLQSLGYQRRSFGPPDPRAHQAQQQPHQQQRHQTVFASSSSGGFDRTGAEIGRMLTGQRFLESLSWRDPPRMTAPSSATPMSPDLNTPFVLAPWNQQQEQQQLQQQPQQQQQQRQRHCQEAGSSPEGFYAYCFDRGDGNYTRLIPADMLPPLLQVPSLQKGFDGMLVLPLPARSPPHGPRSNVEPVTLLKTPPPSPVRGPDNIQNKIDHIIATTPTPQKKPKIYCDKWVHEGVCAFTQQGCKYKHEMPVDKATQMSLGLFHGLPTWWKKQQTEKQREEVASTRNSGNVDLGYEGRGDGDVLLEARGSSDDYPLASPGLPRTQQTMSWRRQDSTGSMQLSPPPSVATGGMVPLSSPAYAPNISGLRSSETSPFPRSTSSPTSPCAFGPIAPPSRYSGADSGPTSHPVHTPAVPGGGGVGQNQDTSLNLSGNIGSPRAPNGQHIHRGGHVGDEERLRQLQSQELARFERLRLG